VWFDCTTGGEAQLGQLWELRPRRGDRGVLRLVYESTSAADLENPDNVVVVPASGDVFLQEDSDGEQFVRGVTRRGRIYDFARTLLNTSEFCGGCFSPDGGTFFLNQQGGRLDLAAGETPTTQPDTDRGLTYAIWGPFGDTGGGA
jgi:secreted PhoX family phosphatase